MQNFFPPFLILSLVTLLAGCSSSPKLSDKSLSNSDAKTWLKTFCSKTPANDPVHGEMVLRANTQEFKGQFPASIEVLKNSEFVLEVTNILGGTMAQILGDEKSIQVKSSSKPKFNRTGVNYYMGIPAKTLVQLVRGDLPCPDENEWKKVLSDGASIVIDTGAQKWAFMRIESVNGEVPAKIRIEPQKIDLSIDEWDFERHFAKKVTVKTEAGNLKWTWKSHDLK